MLYLPRKTTILAFQAQQAHLLQALNHTDTSQHKEVQNFAERTFLHRLSHLSLSRCDYGACSRPLQTFASNLTSSILALSGTAVFPAAAAGHLKGFSR